MTNITSLNEKVKMVPEKILGSKARIKILILLAKNTELNISSIISRTNLNHKTVVKHLKYLLSVNMIIEKIFGRIKIYGLNLENIRSRSFKRMIKIWDENCFQ